MQIKKIKTIDIGSDHFKVKWDTKENYGSFEYEKRLIVIGTSSKNNTRILEIIIHELKEIIQVEQSTRYDVWSSKSEYLFSYHHHQHTDLCSRLAGLLNKFIV